MTDIHSHFLPYVDDGAADFTEAVAMVRIAAANGTKRIITTPHFNANSPGTKAGLDFRRDVYKRFADAVVAEKLPVDVYFGCEFYAASNTNFLLERGIYATLAGGRYLLVEFDFSSSLQYIRDVLASVAAHGLIPVLAHPERYIRIQADQRPIYDWVLSGCIIQVNKSSLEGKFGRGAFLCADSLMRHGLVHVVASDTHSVRERTPDLSHVYALIAEKYSQKMADMLLSINPGLIIDDKELKKALLRARRSFCYSIEL